MFSGPRVEEKPHVQQDTPEERSSVSCAAGLGGRLQASLAGSKLPIPLEQHAHTGAIHQGAVCQHLEDDTLQKH